LSRAISSWYFAKTFPHAAQKKGASGSAALYAAQTQRLGKLLDIDFRLRA
jgi:hypothetical protein